MLETSILIHFCWLKPDGHWWLQSFYRSLNHDLCCSAAAIELMLKPPFTWRFSQVEVLLENETTQGKLVVFGPVPQRPWELRIRKGIASEGLSENGG